MDHPEFVGRIWGGSDAEDEVVISIPELNISSCYPNPFSNELSYSVESKNATPASVTIYNLRGQAVFRENLVLQPGENKFSWNGRDEQDKPSPAGIYFIRITDPKSSATVKVIKT